MADYHKDYGQTGGNMAGGQNDNTGQRGRSSGTRGRGRRFSRGRVNPYKGGARGGKIQYNKGRTASASDQADAISTAKPRRPPRKIVKRGGSSRKRDQGQTGGNMTVTGGGAVTNTYGRR